MGEKLACAHILINTFGFLGWLFRRGSNCRLGGSLPILIAYFSEFIPRASRVRFICALLACWAFGGIYVPIMAWTILPKTGQFFSFPSSYYVLVLSFFFKLLSSLFLF